jgi:hypothetical protein
VRDDVFLSPANHAQLPDWKPVPNFFAFLWSIFATAQNYRDNTQSMLPSFRERIAHLRLSNDEGGLNLTMGADVIKRVKDKGTAAGALFRDFNFDHHRWVRLLVLMADIEANLEELVKSNTKAPISDLIDEQLKGDFPYSRDERWCAAARARVDEMLAFASACKKPAFKQDAPKPSPMLRLTPRI